MDPIPGTELSYGANTGSPVFKYAPTGAYYYLTSGRWFTASGSLGPWTFASYSLPSDFAQIPPNSPKSSVLASVPGTPQAEDAVLMAQIPTTVTVNPAKAASEGQGTYDGTPQFLPITGTSMSYATNTPNKVIQVGDEYYLCYRGYGSCRADSAGPWTDRTDGAEQVIYTIPPSSPVYNVTYVTQTAAEWRCPSQLHGGIHGSISHRRGGRRDRRMSGTGYYYPPYIYHGYLLSVPDALRIPQPTIITTGAYSVSESRIRTVRSAHWGTSYNPNTGTYAGAPARDCI